MARVFALFLALALPSSAAAQQEENCQGDACPFKVNALLQHNKGSSASKFVSSIECNITEETCYNEDWVATGCAASFPGCPCPDGQTKCGQDAANNWGGWCTEVCCDMMTEYTCYDDYNKATGCVAWSSTSGCPCPDGQVKCGQDADSNYGGWCTEVCCDMMTEDTCYDGYKATGCVAYDSPRGCPCPDGQVKCGQDAASNYSGWCTEVCCDMMTEDTCYDENHTATGCAQRGGCDGEEEQPSPDDIFDACAGTDGDDASMSPEEVKKCIEDAPMSDDEKQSAMEYMLEVDVRLKHDADGDGTLSKEEFRRSFEEQPSLEDDGTRGSGSGSDVTSRQRQAAAGSGRQRQAASMVTTAAAGSGKAKGTLKGKAKGKSTLEGKSKGKSRGNAKDNLHRKRDKISQSKRKQFLRIKRNKFL